eukprot:snap_masked-scaffold_87-processed-gene-0.3-mRNA-1 protein AED:1.00 eAED:1.00 QI:0/-1/0/0/-1/1/1/0/94
MKNIISKYLHKQLLKYTKSYGENLQELELEINVAAFYTFKYAPSLNNLSKLSSLKLSMDVENRKYIVPLLFSLGSESVFERLNSFSVLFDYRKK